MIIISVGTIVSSIIISSIMLRVIVIIINSTNLRITMRMTVRTTRQETTGWHGHLKILTSYVSLVL